MQQFDMPLNGGTGMKQFRIYYEERPDDYVCTITIAQPGTPDEEVGTMTIAKEDWKSVPNMFAHNTILISR